jgi:GNAT superfamily N-acetyltransferase
MKIEITQNPDRESLKILSQGIQSFNQEHLPDEIVFEPDTNFVALSRDEQGQLNGGIRAKAFWNYCFIGLLWLDESTRGQGIGRELMDATHAYAKELGFEYMRTETLSFQAKPFYEKMGYTVFGELCRSS